MTRAVLFDLDDTLCDAVPAFARGLEAAVEFVLSRHPGLAEDDVVAAWVWEHEALFAALDGGTMTMTGVRHARFRRTLAALEVTGGGFADLLDLRLGTIQLEVLRLFEDASVIEELRGRGLFVGIVTNGADDDHPDSQRTKARHLGLLDRVDGFWASDATGFRKPDPRAFGPALRAAGCAPDEALFVGDSVGADVLGANRAGMRSVLVRRGSRALPSVRPEGAEPWRVVGSLREIVELVGEILRP